MAQESASEQAILAVSEAHFGHSDKRFINRELSWLAFNNRVLEEAHNVRHPLLERVNFLSISASNLDEFYMVRVAGLKDLVLRGEPVMSQDGLTAQEQLQEIHDMAGTLLQEQQACWAELRQLLAAESIHVLEASDLTAEEKQWLETYFVDHVFPVLTPIAIDPAHPFPFLPNRSLSSIYELRDRERNKRQTAIIPFPQMLERFTRLPGKAERWVRTETMVQLFLDTLFPGYEIIASGMFRILRDSDLDIAEDAEDLMRGFEEAVRERKRGSVIRMKVDSTMPRHLLRYVQEHFQVPDIDVVTVNGMLGLASLAELVAIDRPDLKFVPYTPRFPERINDFNGDCFAAIHAKDIIVHHPYESFDVVVRFLQQAARDPDVVAIKQTLYRTSKDSPIVRALIEAADSGKSVTAVVELRARFDEEANIKWARDLERVGVHVVYGVVHLKTHAKMSLVTKRIGDHMQSFVHFGTGNYHPITARIYTDLSFFTCDTSLCHDAAATFNYLTGYAAPRAFNILIPSPMALRSSLLAMIDEEIAHVREGRPGQIWAKMNALVDPEIIDALYRASCEGVDIDLIIRGICCLRPGIEGLSERITVRSIIGRYLEHSRIVCFGAGHGLPSPEAKVFISSADWMPRNLDRRVECMVPIENATVHEQVLDQIMVANLRDDLQSWELQPDGVYERVQPEGKRKGFSAHDYFMHNPSLSGRGKALYEGRLSPPSLVKRRGKKKGK